jgi:hypothetical protein
MLALGVCIGVVLMGALLGGKRVDECLECRGNMVPNFKDSEAWYNEEWERCADCMLTEIKLIEDLREELKKAALR